ncbi:MAG: hypothetical protein R2880_10620 [Deinococcales bacterium]
MTETVVSSHSKTVIPGFDRPFVIIGERINPTGRKSSLKKCAKAILAAWKKMPSPKLRRAHMALMSMPASP